MIPHPLAAGASTRKLGHAFLRDLVHQEHFRVTVSNSQVQIFSTFQIFDNDGDGLLSYQEFIAMMKDRVHRGLKSFSRQEGWTGFKRCVKQEVKSGSSS